MKKLAYLMNFEFRQSIKKTLAVSTVMVIAELICFLVTFFKDENQYLRFEDLLDISGYPPIFYISLGVVLLIIVFAFYQNFLGSKSIYTLMTLPVKRSYVYISKYLSALLNAMVLAAVQIFNVFLTYKIYIFSFPEIPKLNNALFLSFMRSKFLRVLMPFDILSFIASLFILGSFISIVLYGVICERSKNFTGFIILTTILTVAFISVFPIYKNDIWGILRPLIFIISCTGFAIYYSIRALEKSKIL